MRSTVNRILMIVMNDGERYVYSVPNDRPPEIIMRDAINADGIDIKEIKTNYFFPHTLYSVNDYLLYFDEESQKINELPLAVDFKVEEVKKHRQSFFAVLDLEFMKSLEENNTTYTQHITNIKNFLRDLPINVEEHCKNLKIDEIVKFNAFNNIFDIAIINGGSGYTKPPIVSVEESEFGFPVKAVPQIKDGKVSGITVTQVGSGYSKSPAVNISPPDEEGEVAIAAAGVPENDIHSTKKN
tara:strand:+ start:5849 stop:6571 length:723 start_codon:yes stop_codon:yes gene_type:complete